MIQHPLYRRKNGPVETTILIIAYNDSEETVKFYKNLLNQFYSNFDLLIIDLSPQQQATHRLKLVPDARFRFIGHKSDYPPYEERKLIKLIVKKINTAFVIVCRSEIAIASMAMEYFCMALRKAEANVISISYNLILCTNLNPVA